MIEQEFQDAIIAEPANELLRFAYSDWLMERGRWQSAELMRKCSKLRPEVDSLGAKWWRGCSAPPLYAELEFVRPVYDALEGWDDTWVNEYRRSTRPKRKACVP